MTEMVQQGGEEQVIALAFDEGGPGCGEQVREKIGRPISERRDDVEFENRVPFGRLPAFDGSVADNDTIERQ